MHCLNIVLKINVLSPPVPLSELMFLAFILLQRCWALLGTRTVLGACALQIDEMGTGGWSSLWSCGVAMSRRIPSLSFWLFHQFQLSSESYVYCFLQSLLQSPVSPVSPVSVWTIIQPNFLFPSDTENRTTTYCCLIASWSGRGFLLSSLRYHHMHSIWETFRLQRSWGFLVRVLCEMNVTNIAKSKTN